MEYKINENINKPGRKNQKSMEAGKLGSGETYSL
jgi:hypothetical protein